MATLVSVVMSLRLRVNTKHIQHQTAINNDLSFPCTTLQNSTSLQKYKEYQVISNKIAKQNYT